MSELLAVAHDGGVGRIYCDAAGAWLSGVDGCGGTLIGDRRIVYEGIPTGFAVGGLLPEGATRAVLEGVAAPTGGGAWLAIVASNHPEPAVRFEGENGEIVRPAHPADWLVEPVADADAPCSACSATQWERVTPTDDSRGSRGSDAGGWEPTPVIVCVRCGHEESEGAWYAATDDDAGRIDAVEQRDAIAVRRAEHAALLRETDLPLYALAGAPSPPTLSGWGVTGSRIDHVTVRHGELIELAMDAHRAVPPLVAARDALVAMLPGFGAPPPMSIPALTVWIAARQCEQHALATAAEPFEVEVAVDGSPVRFSGIRTSQSWAAVADTDVLRITIAARDLEPAAIALRRLGPDELGGVSGMP